MKCPYCQRENYQGARYCEQCGALLPKPESRGKKVFLALLHAMLYYAAFFGIQTMVVFIYEFYLIMGASGGLLMDLYSGGDASSSYDALMTTVMEQLQQNLHIVLILSAVLTVLTYCIVFHLRHRNPMQEMHVRAVPASRLLFAALFGISLQAVATITIAMLPIPASLIESFNQNAELMYGGPIVLEMISVVIFTPLVEELTFRGLVFTRLRRGMSLGVAVVLSAVIFGAAHGHIISFVYAGLLGVLLACIMLRNHDSVLAAIFCHAGFNGASYLVSYIPDGSIPLVFAIYLAAIALAVCSGYMVLRKLTDDTASIKEISTL